MGWYRVTKKINGRFYDYWQRTYRVGKSVKTENRYIGPSSNQNSINHPSIFSGTLYRGGGAGSMPKGLTALDVFTFERDELGNDIKPELGIDLSKIRSDHLLWLTETKLSAEQYGQAEPITGSFRIVARDNYKGILVERVVAPPLA